MTILEQILAGLQQKFNGADSATLLRIATKKSEGITDESQVQSIIEGISFGDVMQSYGDYRVGDATKTVIANYEKKHNLKDGKPIEVEDVTKKDDVIPAWAQSIIDTNKTLTEKLAGFEKQKAQDERSALVAAKAKEYGLPENLVSMLKISEDADLDVYMKDAKQIFANLGFEGVIPPEQGDEEVKNSQDIAALINKGTAEIINNKN